MSDKKLSVRVNADNLNHHLWNNNGTFWCHFTVHLPDFTKERRRLSLRTGNVAEARRRRDSLLGRLRGEPKAGGGVTGFGRREPVCLESEVASC